MNELYRTSCTEETEAVGESLARRLLADGKTQICIALHGEMGVGKTAFVRGFARVLGCSAVRSPTYTVVNEYCGEPVPVFHFDLYRIADEEELYAVGFDDYLARPGYILCEWSENAESSLPPERMTVTINRVAEMPDARVIEIKE